MRFFSKINQNNLLHNRVLIVFFASLFLLVLIRTAWISDDAAITLRTVLNFTHGFGPTFNIDERVQAYTHPLWFLLLSVGSYISGNVFYTTFFLSIFISVATLIFLLGTQPRNLLALVLISAAAVLSKSFVDFSTSGLENTLSHLILLIAVVYASLCLDKGKNRLTGFFLSCSALYLNRPDLLLMMLPMAIYLFYTAYRKPEHHVWKSILISSIPVVLWTGFSIFYYGFPFPNTAYAKLGTGIDLDERVVQGLIYILHVIIQDPITAFFIMAGIIIGIFSSVLNRWLSIGIILYLVYILSIGGDFMMGRFLSAPFFVSLIIIARESFSKLIVITLIVSIIVLGSRNIIPNFISGSSYSNQAISIYGVADERGYYYQRFGLLAATKNTFKQPQWFIHNEKVETICGELGFNSIRHGPGMHYIDTCALADPLLARLPAKYDPNWRIGHFNRQLPTNYQESLEKNKNLLADENTKKYWDSIRIVTRDGLFNKNRLFEIIKLNFGFIEKPDYDMYRYHNVKNKINGELEY